MPNLRASNKNSESLKNPSKLPSDLKSGSLSKSLNHSWITPTFLAMVLLMSGGCKAILFKNKKPPTPVNNPNVNQQIAQNNQNLDINSQFNSQGNSQVGQNLSNQQTLNIQGNIEGRILRYVAGDAEKIQDECIQRAQAFGGDVGEMIGREVGERRLGEWGIAIGEARGRSQGSEEGIKSGKLNAFYINACIDLLTDTSIVLTPSAVSGKSVIDTMLEDINKRDVELAKIKIKSEHKDREGDFSAELKRRLLDFKGMHGIEGRVTNSATDRVIDRIIELELAEWMIAYVSTRNTVGLEASFVDNGCYDLLKLYPDILYANSRLVELSKAINQFKKYSSSSLEERFNENPEGFRKLDVMSL